MERKIFKNGLLYPILCSHNFHNRNLRWLSESSIQGQLSSSLINLDNYLAFNEKKYDDISKKKLNYHGKFHQNNDYNSLKNRNSNLVLSLDKHIYSSPILCKYFSNCKLSSFNQQKDDIFHNEKSRLHSLDHFISKNISSTFSDKVYDAIIIGGGVTGTALLYLLSVFTDLKYIGLCERRQDFAMVASSARNNSQTIHCGDIETNYTLEKAQKVKRNADMLRNFVTKLDVADKNLCVEKFPKMVISVGSEECRNLRDRYNLFKNSFQNMRLLDKEQIRKVEPMVIMKDKYTDRAEEICAIYVDNEYTGIDYECLTKCFLKHALSSTDKNISLYPRVEVNQIEKQRDVFCLKTNKGEIYSRFVVASACGNSLLLAQKMNYGKNFSCLPVAGSFYFTKKSVLNGKVYTIQNPALPFAAVHGDPDMIEKDKTRIGPTALPLPMLERYNLESIKDFLSVLNFDSDLMKVYFDLLKNKEIRNYSMKNFLFEVPYLNKRLFVKDAQKIIPSLQVNDIEYAENFGGVRPQLIDKKLKKLLLGEGKITPEGENLIFNVTPSPGATTCIGNGIEDVRIICKALGATIFEDKLKNIIFNGEYTISV